jgi:uroporphyrinogen decarboxylase
MNARQRFIETLLFGKADRVPLVPGNARESTLATWQTQGLPASISKDRVIEYAYRQAGGQEPWPETGSSFPVNERMIPQFEEKVIEERDRTRIVQDWKGNVCEIGRQFSVEHLRNAIDFVTRRWIRCPVGNRHDWEEMKKRYDPHDPARLPENPGELGKHLEDRTWVIELTFPGPFWQMREWLGFEGLCTAFYDDPEMIEDMVEFWKSYIGKLLNRIFEHITPDSIRLGEDMAYKGHSMISPEMVRHFLLPCYVFWGEIIRGAGCPIYAMDSDGYIAELIPLWMEAGINACDPMEVAAGNDIVRFRKLFGREMAYRGGVDKRAMARGGDALMEEIDRLRPVIQDGGYIPGCDHGVPWDVSWQNYVETVRLLSEATGWL